MAHETATPRPWAWEWNDSECITIFQPSGKLHCVEVGEVYCMDHKKDDHRLQAEHDADLIVTAVNTYNPTRHLHPNNPLRGQQQSLKENLRGQEQDDD